MLKILHVSHFDNLGGAARAAYRLHFALRATAVDSRMKVVKAVTDNWTVSPQNSKSEKLISIVKQQLSATLTRTAFKTRNQTLHSPQIFPSRLVNEINSSDADVVNLHWVQGEMLSISDIAKIKKPMVWTLHDMWAFCGAEHITESDRWRHGYTKSNRPSYESGFDINRWTWNRKRKYWRSPIHIVTPSQWLGACVESSALLGHCVTNVVPNTIDVEQWKPVPMDFARDLLGLPSNTFLVAFGAMGGTHDTNKGFDLLAKALKNFKLLYPEKKIELLIFGQSKPQSAPDLGFPTHFAGRIHDDLCMRIAYSAVNAFILPSRIENLPNTGIESLSCGTPVVAFDTCGLPDIVKHKSNGCLAKAYDTEALAHALGWVFEHPNPLQLRSYARNFAVSNFSHEVIAPKYIDIYQNILSKQMSS